MFYSDIASLAKAAVAGDEAALDMLSWRKSNKSTSNPSSDYSFFFGVVDGKLIRTRVISGFAKLQCLPIWQATYNNGHQFSAFSEILSRCVPFASTCWSL